MTTIAAFALDKALSFQWIVTKLIWSVDINAFQWKYTLKVKVLINLSIVISHQLAYE